MSRPQSIRSIEQRQGDEARRVAGSRRVAGVGAAAVGLLSRPTSYAIAGNPTKVRLSWTEFAACHSPIAFALSKGIYAKHDLDVELYYQGASGQTLIQSIATGKTDAGAGLLYDWVKPLEQGLDVKLFVWLAWRLHPAAGIQGLWRHHA